MHTQTQVGSEEVGFVPPSDMPRDKGKGLVNPFATNLECNQRLVFLFENPQRDLIYRDTNGRILAKTQEHSASFQREPWVNFQGDICIGEDGARYVVTKQQKLIDALVLLKLMRKLAYPSREVKGLEHLNII